MQLDFTGLNKIASSQGAAPAPGDQKPDEPAVAAGSLQREADQRKQTLKDAADVYKTYQNNIRTTEILQAQILKGIRQREDIYSLFLKASKALSLTVSDRLLYSQILRELPEYYPEAKGAAEAAAEQMPG